jgi:hypothetical protein
MTVQNTPSQEERCAALVKEQEKGRASQEEPRAADTMRANQQKLQSQTQDWEESMNCHGMAAAARREENCWFKICKI